MLKTERARKHRLGVTLSMAAALSFLYGCSTAPDTTSGWTDRKPSQLAGASARHGVVRVASRMIGVPYRYGGNTRTGFDCSGLVQYAHRQVGLTVPRTTASQMADSRALNRRQLRPGDLLFFSLGKAKSRHVGIYESNGVFIHAPSSGKRVSRASLENPYWRSHLIEARSFL